MVASTSSGNHHHHRCVCVRHTADGVLCPASLRGRSRTGNVGNDRHDLALTEGVRWQTGMAVALSSGTLFLALTLAGLREVVIRVVPAEIKVALSAALGMFIVTLGFRNAGLAIADPRVNAFALGNFAAHGAIVALVGLVVVVALHIRKVPGSILLAMVAATAAGIPLGITKVPPHFFALPGSIAPVTLQLDFWGALQPALFPYLFAFFAAEFFSTMGTTLALAGEASCLTSTETCRASTDRSWSIRQPPRWVRCSEFRIHRAGRVGGGRRSGRSNGPDERGDGRLFSGDALRLATDPDDPQGSDVAGPDSGRPVDVLQPAQDRPAGLYRGAACPDGRADDAVLEQFRNRHRSRHSDLRDHAGARGKGAADIPGPLSINDSSPLFFLDIGNKTLTYEYAEP